MVLLSSTVAVYAAAVLLVPGFGPQFLAQHRLATPGAVPLHLTGGAIALVVGPWQLNSRVRARALDAHRWLGRAYLVAVVAGSLGGLTLAPRSQEGFVTLAGVTLRIWLPLELAAGLPYHDAYQAVAWLCWIPNLIVAEWFVLER